MYSTPDCCHATNVNELLQMTTGAKKSPLQRIVVIAVYIKLEHASASIIQQQVMEKRLEFQMGDFCGISSLFK